MKTSKHFHRLGVQPTPGLVVVSTLIWLLPLGTLWLVLFLWIRKAFLRSIGRPVIVARIH